MEIKCLFFDVFGTCVDWRKSITDYLWKGAQDALGSDTLSSRVREIASSMTYEDWGKFAQEWRNSYLTFTRSIANGTIKEYKTVDQHHLDSLKEILVKHHLADENGSLFQENKLLELSMEWHHLAPWDDARNGITELNKAYKTYTLSNGNMTLLNDLTRFADLPFTGIYSAEMFNSYKPDAKVYLGAAEKMGLKPQECCMVAAHLDDLKYAQKCGFKTLYVERPQEERYAELLGVDGLVDYWVKMEEEGFVAAAARLAMGEKADVEEWRSRSQS